MSTFSRHQRDTVLEIWWHSRVKQRDVEINCFWFFYASIESILVSKINDFRKSDLFTFPVISLGFTILGEILAYATVFFFFFFFFLSNHKGRTIRLRGWCMLGVFLLPAFPRLRHECQNLLSSLDGMNVCTEVCTLGDWS